MILVTCLNVTVLISSLSLSLTFRIGWSHVSTSRGSAGWVPTRYLSTGVCVCVCVVLCVIDGDADADDVL